MRTLSALTAKLEDFQIDGRLGKGAYGKVLLVTHKATDEQFAMKVLSKRHIIESSTVDEVLRERDALSQLSHPYVVRLHYLFHTEEHIFFVMNAVLGGDLYHQLRQRVGYRVPESWAMLLAAELVLALDYLHQHDLVFRDLKPENVLVGMDGHLQLADFGLAKHLQSGDRTKTVCGTPFYMAPEVIEEKGYDKTVDWWSLGALMFEMVTGSLPFGMEQEGDLGSVFLSILTAKLTWPDASQQQQRRQQQQDGHAAGGDRMIDDDDDDEDDDDDDDDDEGDGDGGGGNKYNKSSDMLAVSAATKLLVGKLLERDPSRRLGGDACGGVESIKDDGFFAGLDWAAVEAKALPGPLKVYDECSVDYDDVALDDDVDMGGKSFLVQGLGSGGVAGAAEEGGGGGGAAAAVAGGGGGGGGVEPQHTTKWYTRDKAHRRKLSTLNQGLASKLSTDSRAAAEAACPGVLPVARVHFVDDAPAEAAIAAAAEGEHPLTLAMSSATASAKATADEPAAAGAGEE